MTSQRLELFAPSGFPLIRPDDALDEIILDVLKHNSLALRDGDILVLAQKIVSKAEGRYVRLAEVDATRAARDLAEQCGKDPRLESPQPLDVGRRNQGVEHTGPDPSAERSVVHVDADFGAATVHAPIRNPAEGCPADDHP